MSNTKPALAVRRDDGMNKTEAAYADRLSLLQRSGEILSFAFEPIKLRLGKACWYTPDFMVVNAAGEIEFHEVKGFWRDDARVKIKAAAHAYRPFRFIAAQLVRREWKFEEF